jgi:hypothetical protein
MTKIAGSGSGCESISQRHGSADPDPDPPQNVMDPQHCKQHFINYQYASVCGIVFCSFKADAVQALFHD